MSKNTRTRILLTAVAALLLVTMAVGGTLAWLKDTTEPVTNTFTPTTIDIVLDETTETYEMVPGSDIDKDPFVTVESGSEECWIFVEVVEAGSVTVGSTTYTFDHFLTYAIDSNWTIVEGSKNDAGNDTYVIGYNTTIDASNADMTKQILADDKVTVKTSVSKAMMDAVTDANAPKLTFTAYAVQSANINAADVTAAWAVYKAN